MNANYEFLTGNINFGDGGNNFGYDWYPLTVLDVTAHGMYLSVLCYILNWFYCTLILIVNKK